MSDTRPLGFDAANADWNEALAGRDMNEHDWNQLTLGEQARYARTECRTKGAIYKSMVSANRVEFAVDLPASLQMTGLTATEAKQIERYLHNAFEREIAGILRLRELGNGRLP